MSKSSDWHPDFTGDFGARVWFPDLIKEVNYSRSYYLELIIIKYFCLESIVMLLIIFAAKSSRIKLITEKSHH